jgi:peroxiredoxin
MATPPTRGLAAGLGRLLGAAALAAACLLVLLLGFQNRALRRDVRHLRFRDGILHEGLVVPAFRAATLAGDSVMIGGSESGGRQVLFVFNTTCPYCLRSLPGWRTIAARLASADRPRITVVGVTLDSLEPTRRYVAAHQLGFPVVRFPNARTAGIYRATGVPITVVLDHEGNVLYGHGGPVVPGPVMDSVLSGARTPRDTSQGGSRS